MKKTIFLTLAAALTLASSYAQDQMHPVKPANPTNNIQAAPKPANPKIQQVDPGPGNPKQVSPKEPVDPKHAAVSPKNTAQVKQQQAMQMQQQKHRLVPPKPVTAVKGGR